MSGYSVYEVFEKINSFKGEEFATALKANLSNATIRGLLYWNFSPKVKRVLPQGAPDFKKSQAHDNFNILWGLHNKFKYFVTDEDNIKKIRREMMFIEILEILNEKDAQLLIHVKDGKLNKLFEQFSSKNIQSIIPELFEA